MVRIALAALAVVGLSGCSAAQKVLDIQEVDKPVAVMSAPPDELTTPIPSPAFRFILPTDPKAVVALDKAGVSAFVDWGEEARRRIEAWEAWAVKP